MVPTRRVYPEKKMIPTNILPITNEKIRKRKSKNDYITVKIDITDLVKAALTELHGEKDANNKTKSS